MTEVTNDLDEMTRVATRLADAGNWDGVLGHRDACRAALERGLQLWPVASYCEYRLALEAPPEWAARMLVPEAGRFALGPLTEVVAVQHTWEELAPHSPGGPMPALAAHERVVRGEDLTGADIADAHVLEVPLVLQQWEPPYPLAHYTPEEADFPAPQPPPLVAVELPANAPGAVDDYDAVSALRELGRVWSTESNGRVDVVAVDADALGAHRALGVPRARAAPLPGSDALALMAWTGASGGAHGRRQGMGPGRFAAWWTAAALAGALDEWPLPADEIGGIVTQQLRWYAWDAHEPTTGWSLRLAVEDPVRERAFAIAATDST